MKRYFEQLQEEWRDGPLADWLPLLPEIVEAGLNPKRYGDLPKWQGALEALPSVENTQVELQKEVAIDGGSTAQQRANINAQLQALIPWRKGPFTVHGTHIDTEWRSDWKWDRLLPHIADLNERLVLDVGCGNGYHCWRMLGEGAARVVGIDPSPRFVVQFLMIRHFLANAPVDVLPCTLDELPPLPVFDSVFSMGVLYHRPSPIDHLRQLKSLLRPGGELVLETLVIDGDDQSVLVPSGRYAMMNNVWFIPSPASLLIWLAKLGFRNPRVVDISRTTCEEQRATEWMRFHSLANFLDPADPDKTIEGYPAPLRAIFVADCD